MKWEFFDFLKDLVWIVIIVILIRTFFAEPFQISGQSMANSYYDREFIIVDRFSYLDIPLIKDGKINRWEVIVFKPWVSKTQKYFIKRVIWLPWDTIRIENWDVFLKIAWTKDFIKLDEKYLNDSNNWKTKVWWLETEHNYIVPKWEYFVMWDNRNHSSDSRTCFSSSCDNTLRDSFISKKEITGKLFLDLGYFDFSNFSFVHSGVLTGSGGEVKYEWLKWRNTLPRWFSSPSTYDYGF